MIHASLRHQLLTIEAGYTVTVHLDDGEPTQPEHHDRLQQIATQLGAIGELSGRLEEINANVETVIGFVAPEPKNSRTLRRPRNG